MNIQFNTSNNINGSETMNTRLSNVIAEKLNRFSDYITRIEAHLSDSNGQKEGQKVGATHWSLKHEWPGMESVFRPTGFLLASAEGN